MALFREFVGLDAGEDKFSDESSVLRFCYLIEVHKLILRSANVMLVAKGLQLKRDMVSISR